MKKQSQYKKPKHTNIHDVVKCEHCKKELRKREIKYFRNLCVDCYISNRKG